MGQINICLNQINTSAKQTNYSIRTRGEKEIVVLTNQIFDIELTKLFCFTNKISVFPTKQFVEPTKECYCFLLDKTFCKKN